MRQLAVVPKQVKQSDLVSHVSTGHEWTLRRPAWRIHLIAAQGQAGAPAPQAAAWQVAVWRASPRSLA